jgi:hypothetical protein
MMDVYLTNKAKKHGQHRIKNKNMSKTKVALLGTGFGC